MSKKKLTAAVVGLGNIGLGYDLVHRKDYVQTHTKAYLTHKGFELLFGVDPDAGKRAAFQRFSRKASYLSLTEASTDFPSVDVVSVCVGLEHRASLWDEISHIRPKILVLEKPLAQSPNEGRCIVSWAVQNGIKLCVNYLRRFEDSTSKLQELFKKNKYGSIIGVDIRYNGGFYNNASHYIDLMVFLFGKPSKVRHLKKKKDVHDFRVDFSLQYPSFQVHGKSVDMDCPVGELTFWCEKAQICYRKFGQEIEILTPQADPVFRKFKELAHRASVKTTMPYAMAHVIDHICQAYHGRENFLSDGESAIETLEICEHILLNG